MERIPKPQVCPPLDSDKFEAAFAYAANAYVGRAAVWDPKKFKIRMTGEDGDQILSFTDAPNKAMMAFKERFPESLEFYSAALRFWAVTKLIREKKLDKWVRPVPGNPAVSEIHSAVFDAAATVKMNSRGHFNVKIFLKEVQKIADEKYPE